MENLLDFWRLSDYNKDIEQESSHPLQMEASYERLHQRAGRGAKVGRIGTSNTKDVQDRNDRRRYSLWEIMGDT
jgi:hypothetical protein